MLHQQAYFYPSPLYATALLSQALEGETRARPALKRAQTFLLETQEAQGCWGGQDPYATALALAALGTGAGGPRASAALARGQTFLLAAQKEDGSWSSQSLIWRYVRQDLPPRWWNAKDPKGILTTSWVLSALQLLQRQP